MSQNTENSAKIEIGLNAAILAVQDGQPCVLIIPDEQNAEGDWESLPFGPFSPLEHRTLEIGLRSWVSELTGVNLGYVEQLYSFGDRGRHAQPTDTSPHVVSIGYLALTRNNKEQKSNGAHWEQWYKYFPWEDWRNGKPDILTNDIEPKLIEWAKNTHESKHPLLRSERLSISFGIGEDNWDEEKVLERYELLYEAGLVKEAARDGRSAAKHMPHKIPGRPMTQDHRRILATAMGRLRSKIKYRPVIFELMARDFTLFELQKTVEAISGNHIHKQNFRRLVETAGLVEPTGEVSLETGGRPAKLFRFRREVLLERPAPGVKINKIRS
ncbi:MAG: NUDIX hydrolase [Methyloligellaceae bacterium]